MGMLFIVDHFLVLKSLLQWVKTTTKKKKTHKKLWL